MGGGGDGGEQNSGTDYNTVTFRCKSFEFCAVVEQ